MASSQGAAGLQQWHFNLHYKMKFRNECPGENGTKGPESEMIEKSNKTLFLNVAQPSPPPASKEWGNVTGEANLTRLQDCCQEGGERGRPQGDGGWPRQVDCEERKIKGCMRGERWEAVRRSCCLCVLCHLHLSSLLF